MENDRYCKINAVLVQAKRLKICLFWNVCHHSLQKITTMTSKKFFSPKTIWVPKNAENCANFKIVDQGLKECL